MVPLRRPVVDPAELADWDSKTAHFRAGIEDGSIAGIISLVVYSNGTHLVIPRGHLFRDNKTLERALHEAAEHYLAPPLGSSNV